MSKRILIIDDEESLRNAIREALTFEGFEVIEARNGVEGLQVALLEQPDLILLDILMPEMSGLDMLAALREDPRGKALKVIMMTALDDADRIARAIELGCDTYLVKSEMTLGSVVAKVKGVLG